MNWVGLGELSWVSELDEQFGWVSLLIWVGQVGVGVLG